MKKVDIKKIGFYYLLFIVIIQTISSLLIATDSWIAKIFLHNSLENYFSSIKFINVKPDLFNLTYTTFRLIYVLSFFVIREKKYKFYFVPIVALLIDIIFQIILYHSNLLGYIGIAFKLIGCYIFFKIWKSKNTRETQGDGSVC